MFAETINYVFLMAFIRVIRRIFGSRHEYALIVAGMLVDSPLSISTRES